MKLAALKNNFRSVDTSSLVDRVEANLIELLQDRKLKVGDSIPKEIELAEALGVSRTVVREAMLRLRMMGLIESKKKKGAVITSPDLFATMHKTMNPHILDQQTLKEIYEMRLVVEIGMADLLFRRIRKEDITALKRLIAREADASSSANTETDHELLFHTKLYEISGNQTLKKFQLMLLPIFDYVQHSGLVKKQGQTHQTVTHSDLVLILESGDSENFRTAMRSHLGQYFERLLD